MMIIMTQYQCMFDKNEKQMHIRLESTLILKMLTHLMKEKTPSKHNKRQYMKL